MKMNPKQFAAVIALPDVERYRHFIKVVADTQRVWGLFDQGWALAATDDGRQVFTMWPAQEYAQACATGEWERYVPKSFELDELLSGLLRNLARDGMLPGIFFSADGRGVVPSIEQFKHDLEEELQNY